MRQFSYLAVARMGEHKFAIAGTIEIEPGQNGYMAVRHKLITDDLYDEVCEVKRVYYNTRQQQTIGV